MTLAQIFDSVNKKTYFSRDDDEIWAAISNAASTIFLQVVSENSGFFITWDTSTVAFAPNQEEYTLPVQLGEMVRVRERLSATEDWKVIPFADINANSFTQAQFASQFGISFDGAQSEFQFYGPYLTATDAATGAQTQKMRIAPIPLDARQVELVYIAKFADITGTESPKVLPNEADGAVVWSAVEELLATNDDDNSERAGAQKEENLRWFLKWVRNRQFTQVRQVEPYVTDLD